MHMLTSYIHRGPPCQQNYNFLVAFSGLNALFRLPRKPTSPEDYLNLRTVKAGDSLFVTHHSISVIRHV